MKKIIEGTCPENDLRRTFVAGCAFWEYHSTGCTMWQSDRQLAEDEAEYRYRAPNQSLKPDGQGCAAFNECNLKEKAGCDDCAWHKMPAV